MLPPSTPLPYQRICFVTILGLSVAACAPAPREVAAASAHDERGLQRLALTPLGSVAAVQIEDRHLAHWKSLGVAGAAEGWNLPGRAPIATQFKGKDVLVLHRDAPRKVEIPAPFTFFETPRVTISLASRGDMFTLRGLLQKDGITTSVASIEIPKAEHSLQTIAMEFPYVRGAGMECDRIVFEIPQGGNPLAFESVRVDDVALAGALPSEAFGGEALIGIGTDSRRATVITTEFGVRSTFAVERSQQELVFSHGVPDSLIRAGSVPRLNVKLAAAGSELHQQQFRLVGDEFTPPTWQEEHIALAKWVGQTITVDFELESPDGEARIAAIGQPQVITRSDSPRTVLLVTVDSHRADHLGFLAKVKGLSTPALDRLAAGGETFLDTTASINDAMPSYVALFTGLSPRETGIVQSDASISSNVTTLAERFAERGYATLASVSTARVSDPASGLGQGFDRYSNPASALARRSQQTIDQLYTWLADYEGRPLFVWLDLSDAHGPYTPTEEFLDPYYGKTLIGPYDAASPVSDLSLAPRWDPRIADPFFTESLYKGALSYMDDCLARLFALDRFWSGTIAFTADHGETLRDGAATSFEHRKLSRANLAVPLIVRARGLKAGAQHSAPVSQTDLGRSLLDLAGYQDSAFPGVNLFSSSGVDNSPRFAMQAGGHSAAVLSGKWLLQLQLSTARADMNGGDDSQLGDRLHSVALFDAAADETCRRDLSEEHPDVTTKLRAEIVSWLGREHGQRTPFGSDADLERQLQELDGATGPDAVKERAWFPPDCPCVNCRRFR